MKSLETLISFSDYCVDHPEERFWQALRNWSRYNAIMAIDKVAGRGGGGRVNETHDTYYIEGKRHDEESEPPS